MTEQIHDTFLFKGIQNERREEMRKSKVRKNFKRGRIVKSVIILLLLVISSPAYAGGFGDVLNELNKALDQYNQNSAINRAGFDPVCVRLIADLVESKQITLEQGRLMVYEKCRKPSSPLREGWCPICGMIGTPNLGLNGLYYVCPRGHAWK